MSATRPGQNADGQAKQPSANPQGEAKPTPPGVAPSTAPHAAMKLPQQLQMRINYANLSPVDQAQVAQQQLGVDPYRMLEMGQQQVGEAQQLGMAGNPQQGMAPNSLSGPGIPPEAGLDNFPHDMAALVQMMQRGYSPGADAGEHAMAQNAHAIARAQETMAQQNAQNLTQHHAAVQQLGAMFQQMHMAGQLPPPEMLAQHVAQATAPQLGSRMVGGGQSAPGAPAPQGY